MAGPINWLLQVVSVTKFGLLSIPQRRGSALASIIGIAGVVAVLVSVLSMATGFRKTMSGSIPPDAVIVLRSGATSEMVSGLTRSDTRLISEAPGLVHGSDGPLASAELFVIIDLPKRSTGTDVNVPMRGVEHAAFQVRDKLKIVEGRAFEWGKNEVIIGTAAVSQFAGMQVGGKIKVGREQWPIVGIFSANGAAAETEVWTDATMLQGAFNRGDSFQAVYGKLATPGAFSQFKDALTTNPQLDVKVERQAEFNDAQSAMMTTMINTLGVLVAGLMAVGAVFGALNTMYNAVSARTREIATLRALGFGRGSVVFSVMLESLALALIGGLLGAALAYLFFNGHRTSAMNFQSFSQVSFAFDVTPALLVKGIVWAAIIGLIGGIFPAVRAARLPIASALREL
ncbi:MAG: macB 1 [Pedosphaera sp.]|nr:macB 1 [Pedosphaera sp.]